MSNIVYFSSRSENTRRFVDRLGGDALRLPISAATPTPKVTQPYVLVVPTYGGGAAKGAVPKPVIHFLNDLGNRELIRGVISAGNTNFGPAFGLAGDIVAGKCGVPLLYRFELLGTQADVDNVTQGLERFWTRLH